MKYNYELIEYQAGLPINIFVHRVNEVELHWHNEIEIIYVLKGSVRMKVGQSQYLLKEKDIILINRDEVHSTYQTEEDNIMLAFQINPKFCNSYYPDLARMTFDVKSFLFDESHQERFDRMRQYMAKMMGVLTKKSEGYPFQLMILVHSLLTLLLKHFSPAIIDEGNAKSHKKNLERLNRIITYVDENYTQKISLQEIANQEYLSVYYLSHFFKDHVGIPFQEYVIQKRLQMAVDLLLNSDKTITDIATSSGFSDIKFFYKHFNKKYKCKPLDYKHQHMSKESSLREAGASRKGYLSIENSHIFENLFKYQLLENESADVTLPPSEEIKVIQTGLRGIPFPHYWRKLTTFGRAVEGLREDWRHQLRFIQKEIGFEYIRFHGIFNDEMMVVSRNVRGELVFNWTYVDQLFDFFKDIGIKPFLELSFMPSELKRTDETVFWWRGNISPPIDLTEWTQLVTALIRHCINRYGRNEVESWYFEVWNEPDYEGVFWAGSQEEYFELYKQTALAIRSISEKLRVGGPGLAFPLKQAWLNDFITFCTKDDLPMDFISFHAYCEYVDDQDQSDEESADAFHEMMREPYGALYCGPYHTSELARSMTETVGTLSSQKVEVHITEWNVSHSSRNLIHDTAFMAPFVISNVLNCIHTVDSLGFWTCTDIFEEYKAGRTPFHGGFGLLNHDGIKKPSYLAYYLLSKLGDEIIERGEDYIVTRQGEHIQILMYHYVYFDSLFRNGDNSGISLTERYSVYEEKPDKKYQLQLKGLYGTYKMTKYTLNREHGSAFDVWVNMGAPTELTREEVSYLQTKAFPKMHVEALLATSDQEITVQLPVHGVELIVLEKVV